MRSSQMIPWVIGGLLAVILIAAFILRSLIVLWATKGEGEEGPPRRFIPHGWFERGEEV